MTTVTKRRARAGSGPAAREPAARDVRANPPHINIGGHFRPRGFRRCDLPIAHRDDLLAFVDPVAEAWRSFLLAEEEAFRAEPARPVRTPRGALTWVELLEAQRLHAAQHFRQAAAGIEASGHAPPVLDLDAMVGLRLPAAMY